MRVPVRTYSGYYKNYHKGSYGPAFTVRVASGIVGLGSFRNQFSRCLSRMCEWPFGVQA